MRRRLLGFGLVLVTPLLLVLLFVLIFKPHDDLKPLRPYIQSEYVHYYENKTEPGVLTRSRQITLYGMPRRDAYSKATAILQQIYGKKTGWTVDPQFGVGTWMTRGGMANIFGRLDVAEWQGKTIQPFPEDQLVPDTYPFYFQETTRTRDWREKLWARATGSISRL